MTFIQDIYMDNTYEKIFQRFTSNTVFGKRSFMGKIKIHCAYLLK